MYPILFRIGGFELRSYGVMIAIAVIIGSIVTLLEAKRKGIERDKILEFLTWGIIAGAIGARLAYVIFVDPLHYLSDPLKIFAVWEGGLANQGIIAGVILAGIWFARKYNISFWKLADTFAPGAILAQAVGRIGCLLNGDSFGLPARLPWSIYLLGEWRHPTQVYEIILNLAAFAILWGWRKKIKHKGVLFSIYLILYSVNRFIVQFFRADQVTIFGLPAVQTVAVVAIVAAGMLILYLRKGGEKE